MSAELKKVAQRVVERASYLPEGVAVIVIVVDPRSGGVGWVSEIDMPSTLNVLQGIVRDSGN